MSLLLCHIGKRQNKQGLRWSYSNLQKRHKVTIQTSSMNRGTYMLLEQCSHSGISCQNVQATKTAQAFSQLPSDQIPSVLDRPLVP